MSIEIAVAWLKIIAGFALTNQAKILVYIPNQYTRAYQHSDQLKSVPHGCIGRRFVHIVVL